MHGFETGDELPGPGSGPQIPLSLRWETKHHWPALKGELGVTETGAAVILAAYKAALNNPDTWIAYSRARVHYDKPRRYRSRLYTLTLVRGSVDFLDAAGFIIHDRRRPGQRGWQSAFKPKPELIELAARIIAPLPPLRLARPPETVILRDANGQEIDYRDNRETDRMRRILRDYNEALMTIDVPGDKVAPLRRVFNRSFKRGGRFYAEGNSWQNMKKEARRALTINGEPVVEIDYATLHPALLYAGAGKDLQGDAYSLDGWPRQLVKRAFNIMVNADNHHEARFKIATLSEMAELAAPGSQEAMACASQLIEDVKHKHAQIADRFFTDQGAGLMRIDADIAETVMLLCLKKGIVVLPVHDSFLVRQDQAGQLEEAMQQAAYEVANIALGLQRSDAK